MCHLWNFKFDIWNVIELWLLLTSQFQILSVTFDILDFIGDWALHAAHISISNLCHLFSFDSISNRGLLSSMWDHNEECDPDSGGGRLVWQIFFCLCWCLMPGGLNLNWKLSHWNKELTLFNILDWAETLSLKVVMPGICGWRKDWSRGVRSSFVGAILFPDQSKQIYRYIQRYTEIYRDIQRYTEIHRDTQRYTEIYRFTRYLFAKSQRVKLTCMIVPNSILYNDSESSVIVCDQWFLNLL